MTKMHFIRAAEIVRAIVDGEWTNSFPSWADSARNTSSANDQTALDDNYTRAVQTAEAFILLFTEHNPRFDMNRFLIACGLADSPKPKRQ